MEPIKIWSWGNSVWNVMMKAKIFVSNAWYSLFKQKDFTTGRYLPGTSTYQSSTGKYHVSCFEVYKNGAWHQDNFAIIESYRNISTSSSSVPVNSQTLDMGFIDPADRQTYEFTILYNKAYFGTIYQNDGSYLNCKETGDGTKRYNPTASIVSDTVVNDSYNRLVIRVTPCPSGTSTLGTYYGDDHFSLKIGSSSEYGIVLHFFYRGGGESSVYSLSLSYSPSDAVCTLSGEGNYKSGTSATVNATTSSSYWRFSSWSDSGAQSHSVTMDSSKSLVAYFIRRYLIVAGVSGGVGGSVTAVVNGNTYTTYSESGISQYIDNGTVITLSYSTYTGYTFVRWSDNNTDSTRYINATANVNVQAIFEANDVSLYAAVSRQSNGLSIIGSHVYYTNNTQLITNQDLGTGTTVTAKYGDSITLTSYGGSGYVFVGWSPNSTGGSYLSYNASYSFVMGNGKTVYAVYKQDTVIVTFDVYDYGGRISFDGSTYYSPPITKEVVRGVQTFDLYASANSGYKFEQFTDSSGNFLSSSNPYTHGAVSEATTVYAKFVQVTPTISLSRSSYSFAYGGGSFSLTITTNYGWGCSNVPSWITLSSSSGSSSSTITVTASSNSSGARSQSITFYNSYNSSISTTLTISQSPAQYTLTVNATATSSTPYPEMYIRSTSSGSNLRYASLGSGTSSLSYTFTYGDSWYAYVSPSFTQNGTTYSITSNTASGTITGNVTKTFTYSSIAATRAGGYRLYRANSTNQYEGTGRPAVNISRNTNGTYYVYADSWSMGESYWFGCSNLYPFMVVRQISTGAVKEYQVGAKQERTSTDWTWAAGTSFRALGFTTTNTYGTTDYELSIEWRSTDVGSNYYTIS